VYNASVEYKYDEFIKTFMLYFNECFPVVSKTQHYNAKPKWYNEELRKEKQDLIKLSNVRRTHKNLKIIEDVKLKKKVYKKTSIWPNKHISVTKLKTQKMLQNQPGI